ncbi:MAG: ABC transporter permease [Deltaproteobacteria bacterium]|nr:ABC transporter permease [Deltaproteobacteria bacterium]
MIAISLGLALILFSVGMQIDTHQTMIDLGVRMGSGHVAIQAEGYQQHRSLDYLLSGSRRLLAQLRQLSGVRRAIPRLEAAGLVRAGESSAAIAVVGVDPSEEQAVAGLARKSYRRRGRYLSADVRGNRPADIYIGSGLAQTLQVGVGDRVVLTVSPLDDRANSSAAFVVCGIFRTGVTELDSFLVQLPLSAAQQLLSVGDGLTQIAVLLEDGDSARATAARWQARFAAQHGTAMRREILPWQVTHAELYDGLKLDKNFNYLIAGIIFLIIAIGIFNTIQMSVVERTRQFGVMMALGTAPRRMFALVVAEATLIAIVGAIVGLAIGLALHGLMVRYGIDIETMSGGVDSYEFGGVALTGTLHSRLPVPIVALWAAIIVAITLLSGIYPALRATRLRPVSAMRHS